MQEIPKTLAIDYGTVRIGLAVSVLSLADPLKIIPNNERTLGEIKQICKDENIRQILIGISEQKMAEKTKEFAKKLEEEIKLPIIFFDETLSSKETHQKLNISSASRSKKRGHIDHYAASHFLQEWLDS